MNKNITRLCDRCKEERKMDELKNDFSFRFTVEKKNESGETETRNESIVFNELCDKCAQKIKSALEEIK